MLRYLRPQAIKSVPEEPLPQETDGTQAKPWDSQKLRTLLDLLKQTEWLESPEAKQKIIDLYTTRKDLLQTSCTQSLAQYGCGNCGKLPIRDTKALKLFNELLRAEQARTEEAEGPSGAEQAGLKEPSGAEQAGLNKDLFEIWLDTLHDDASQLPAEQRGDFEAALSTV